MLQKLPEPIVAYTGTCRRFTMFVILDNFKCLYVLLVSPPYRISLMHGHGLFKIYD